MSKKKAILADYNFLRQKMLILPPQYQAVIFESTESKWAITQFFFEF